MVQDCPRPGAPPPSLGRVALAQEKRKSKEATVTSGAMVV